MMKKLLIVPLLMMTGSLYAQFTSNMHILVNSNNTTAPPFTYNYHTYQDLTPELAGAGVQISNITIDSFGNYTNSSLPPLTMGMFVFNGSSDIGIDTGLVLGTGWIPNINSAPTYTIPGDEAGICWPAIYNAGAFNPGGQGISGFTADSAHSSFRWDQFSDLVALNNGHSIADANVLDFDFVPQYGRIQLQYVFASEEYPNFDSARYPLNYPATVCDTATDVMGIFLSGPGISGEKNIALIPGTDIPVGINSITPSGWNCDEKQDYSQYYVDNSAGQNVIFNGFTTVLTAKADVTPGATYHLRIAVADGAPHNEIPTAQFQGTIPKNSFYNSAIFLKFGSLISTSSTDSSGTDSTGTGIVNVASGSGVQVYPNPFSNHLQLQANVQYQSGNGYSLVLNDALGRIVISIGGTLSRLNAQLAAYSFHKLPSGFYYLSLEDRQTGRKNYYKLSKVK